MQESARKKTKYSRNETILKIDHLAKAIAHAKHVRNGPFWSKLKEPEICEKPFYMNVRVVLCKKLLEKIPKIGEM